MKPTNSHLSVIEKEKISDYPQTPFKKDDRDGLLWVRNLMISPSRVAVFHQTPHRTSFLCSYRFLACCSSQRLRLRSQTILFHVLLLDFRLEENMAVDFSYNTILTRRKNHAVVCLVSRPKYEAKMLVTDWILLVDLDWLSVCFKRFGEGWANGLVNKVFIAQAWGHKFELRTHVKKSVHDRLYLWSQGQGGEDRWISGLTN